MNDSTSHIIDDEFKLIKPPKLEIGSTIAFVGLSAAHSVLFPKRLERAKNFFESQGYSVKFGSTIHKNSDGKSGTIEERVHDFHQQFLDNNVRAIIATTGGLFCNELLPHLDYELIRTHPKLFCGYSDNTIISAALLKKSNLSSLYGPCVITEFGEYPVPFEYTWKNFIAAASGELNKITPSSKMTDEFIDWFNNDTTSRNTLTNPGYEWLIPGHAKGRLIGGCVISIRSLTGTEYDFNYDNNILFLDIPEGDILGKGLSSSRIDSIITDYENSGKLKNLTGLIVGRLFRQSIEDQKKIKEIFYTKLKNYGIPILYGVDISHSDPMTSVPFGVLSELNSENNSFNILEQGVYGNY